MRKRFLSTILMLCMALTLLPTTTWAAELDAEVPLSIVEPAEAEPAQKPAELIPEPERGLSEAAQALDESYYSTEPDNGLTDVNDWLLSEARYSETEKCFVLTEDYTSWDTGSIWYNQPYDSDFTLEMDYYTGSANRSLGGADGISVAFYADYLYTMAGGEEMGFNGSKGYGIELDTYQNSNRGDPQYNHIALIKESVGNHLATAELPESEDEQWHKLKIVVEDGNCSAYVDGILKLTHSVEPTGYGWIGITSATGNGENLHAVKNISISGSVHSYDKRLIYNFPSHELISMFGREEGEDGIVYYSKQYEYKISAEISNGMSITAKNVSAILDFTGGNAFLSDATPTDVSLGDIAAGENRTVSWTIYAPWPEDTATVTYGVTANIDNKVQLRQTNYIYLDSHKETDHSFQFGSDDWRFSNSSDNFGPTKEGYYLSDEDLARFLNASSIDAYNTNKFFIEKTVQKDWGGSCYGMSAIAVLTKMGIINPNEIQAAASKLHDVTIRNNDGVESFINFYQIQQYFLPGAYYKKFQDMSKEEKLDSLSRLARGVASGGTPVAVGFHWSKVDKNGSYILDKDGNKQTSGHEIVVYGYESGSWKWDNKTYDTRLLTYDPNFPGGGSVLNGGATLLGKDKTSIYIKSDTDCWTIPYYAENDCAGQALYLYGEISDFCNEIEMLDLVNHRHASDNYSASLIATENLRLNIIDSQGKKYRIDGDASDLNVIYDKSYTQDGQYSKDIRIILPDANSSYSVYPSSSDRTAEYMLQFENAVLAAACEGTEEINFSPDGKIKASGVSGSYSMDLVFNEGYHSLPWYETSISGTNCANISIAQAESGIIIEGSDLDNVVVNVKGNDETQNLKFTTDEESVLLTEETSDNGTEPVIMIDSNGDGTYDKRIESYTITFDANGGSVAPVTMATNEDGRLASLPIPTCTGYTFDGWYTAVKGGIKVDKTKVYTEDTTLYAHWIDSIPSVSFTDVAENSYYYDAVMWGISKGYVKGTTDTTFSPNENIRRCDMVLLLYRMAGEPSVSGVSNPFTDVASSAYYYDAVLWGASKGYVKGTSETTFSPGEYIKRGDMVLLLHRMEGEPTASTTNPFTDVSSSDYYYNAIQWAYANNIVKGVTSTSFAPTDNIRRCDMVLLLYRANAK